MKKVTIFVWTMGILCLLAALCIYPTLPDTIPIHWDLKGNVNGYGPALSIFLMPVLALGCDIGMVVSRKTDPKKAQYYKFEGVYQGFRILFSLFMCVVFVLSTLQTLYPDVSYVHIVVPVAIGILFLFIGNTMPKVRPNYFYGIKTPWTLANEIVWMKTHRFCGRVWVIAALLFMMIGMLPEAWAMYMTFSLIGVMVICPFVYSYICFKTLEKENTHD